LCNSLVTPTNDAEPLAAEAAPRGVVRTALRAARLFGDGLYGVDLKQLGKQFCVIEVNDNPSIEAGVEDQVLKDELYGRIMRGFVRRLDERRSWSVWRCPSQATISTVAR